MPKKSYANCCPAWLAHEPKRNAREDRDIVVRRKPTGDEYRDMVMDHLPIVIVAKRKDCQLREIERDSRRVAFGRRK